eukprot:COSAG01_NODE_30115_length_622_cov_2.864245_1_plen_25_part_10
MRWWGGGREGAPDDGGEAGAPGHHR